MRIIAPYSMILHKYLFISFFSLSTYIFWLIFYIYLLIIFSVPYVTYNLQHCKTTTNNMKSILISTICLCAVISGYTFVHGAAVYYAKRASGSVYSPAQTLWADLDSVQQFLNEQVNFNK